MPEDQLTQDERYLRILLESLRVCKAYKPKFGHGLGLTLARFRELYQSDPFYSWLGLDSPLMYAAHKAAGGMTSAYRQIGVGCQRLIQHILMDSLGLTVEQSTWSYEAQKPDGGSKTLYLDGRIPLDAVLPHRSAMVSRWLQSACQAAGVSTEMRRIIKGAVFEIRQGYKSKDSKRQNADIANASVAYTSGYVPVLLLLSTQIDDDVALRYANARWLILRGAVAGSAIDSTYEFSRQVLGYDLEGLFRRHSTQLRQEIEAVLKVLLDSGE